MSCERCDRYERCKKDGRVVVRATEKGEWAMLGVASVCPRGSYMEGVLNTLAEVNEILSRCNMSINIDTGALTIIEPCKPQNGTSGERNEGDDIEGPTKQNLAENADFREEICTIWEAIDILEKRVEKLEDRVYG